MLKQKAVEKLSDSKEDSGRIKILKDCCICCGKKKHSDKTTCPAKDAACPCGRTGHYVHLCFRKGKPTKPKRVKEKEEIGAEDQSDNTESSNLLSETCFRLQSHESVVELHVAGQLVNTEDNTGEVGEVNVS